MIFCRAGETGTSDWAKAAGTAARAAVIRERNMVGERGARQERTIGWAGRGCGVGWLVILNAARTAAANWCSS
jgi:hypothetical protein